MDTMEKLTRSAWQSWGYAYALFTRCSHCGAMKHCRGKHRAHMACVDCFDRKVA